MTKPNTRVIEIILKDTEYDALRQAASNADLTKTSFILEAIRQMAARYKVIIPARTRSAHQVQPSGQVAPETPRHKGGRPRNVHHPMERHVPAGYRQTICPYCHRDFRADDDRTTYCSYKCEIGAANQRQYLKRRQEKQQKGE